MSFCVYILRKVNYAGKCLSFKMNNLVCSMMMLFVHFMLVLLGLMARYKLFIFEFEGECPEGVEDKKFCIKKSFSEKIEAKKFAHPFKLKSKQEHAIMHLNISYVNKIKRNLSCTNVHS